MEAVDVLIRPDFTDHLRAVQPVRQRQLAQNPVDVRIRVQPPDDRHQFFLRSRGRQLDQLRFHTDLRAGFFLACDIRKRSRILSNQDYRQLRHPPAGRAQRRDLFAQFAANVL